MTGTHAYRSAKLPRRPLGLDTPDRIALVCLASSSVLVNLALFAWSGVSHGGDTARYLASADDLIANRPPRGAAAWAYIGYNSLLGICRALGAGDIGVILFQVAVAAVAALTLYDLGRQLHGRVAGLLASAFFIVDYDITRWHFYVLTDSLYISLVVIVTWSAHRAVGRGIRGYLEAAAVLIPSALIRPNGWILVPIVAIYWIGRSGLRPFRKYAAAAAVVAVCVGAAATILASQFPLVERGASARRAIDAQRVPFAPVLARRIRSFSSYPGRLIVEVAHVRLQFSTRHNVMIVAVLAVVYPLAVVGFVRIRRQPLALLIAVVIAGHLSVVTITFPDIDGRYLLHVFPLILVFAGCGAAAIREDRSNR